MKVVCLDARLCASCQIRNLELPVIPASGVVIITKNEAQRIGECLASVAGFADELVVLDSGSTDGTQELCARAARVLSLRMARLRPQKDFMVRTARNDWVLCLDADERVSVELAGAIRSERWPRSRPVRPNAALAVIASVAICATAKVTATGVCVSL